MFGRCFYSAGCEGVTHNSRRMVHSMDSYLLQHPVALPNCYEVTPVGEIVKKHYHKSHPLSIFMDIMRKGYDASPSRLYAVGISEFKACSENPSADEGSAKNKKRRRFFFILPGYNARISR